MGRTISSFRIELAIEKAKRKPFCSASDKSDRKKFDEMMFDPPRLYISQLALLYRTAHKALYSILMSILLHDYHKLVESISQVEQMTSKVEGL
ncbi:MAG: hypothetical protein ACRD5B_08350 [Nitrososphaeraceae archaeon]